MGAFWYRVHFGAKAWCEKTGQIILQCTSSIYEQEDANVFHSATNEDASGNPTIAQLQHTGRNRCFGNFQALNRLGRS